MKPTKHNEINEFVMGEIIDYDNNLIRFQDEEFPFRPIVLDDDGFIFSSIVSTISLERKLYDEENGYCNKQAQWIDEQIVFFVENEADLHLPDQELIKMIYA